MTSIVDAIKIDPSRGDTLAEQLKQQFTWLIASRQLKPGERLPSVRELARHLSINLHTVRNAYRKLELEGLVKTHHGLGTIVLPAAPTQIAATKARLRSHTIGVILPSLENPFYHAFIQGIEECVHKERTMLFVCNAHESMDEARRYFAQLAAKKVDGVILASLDDSAVLETRKGSRRSSLLPFVSVDWPASQGWSVLIDLENAGYLATRHLLEHGHYRVGLITFKGDVSNVDQINAGYERALRQAALQSDPELVAAVGGFLLPDGAEGARKLLGLHQPPTAIFAISDMLALGAMSALKDSGLKIPQDVAVAGFNNIPVSSLVEPQLTTVTAPAREMGLEAMSMLQSLIADRKPAQKQKVLPVSLVIRESCGLHK
jgi:DNA-binding LacI/PurR family transcriptional regulator